MTDTLELDFFDLQAEAGDFAGYGFGDNQRFNDTKWTDDQLRRINKVVNAGVRSVYFTEELEDIPGSYPWSFLRPRAAFTLLNGTNSVPMPDDSNGILGEIIPVTVNTGATVNVKVVDYSTLYSARSQSPTQTGSPRIAYQAPVKDLAAGGRWTLEFFPIADADYALQVWHEISPKAPSAQRPRLYGGPPMAETFKQAVRAAYEQDYDGVRGPETDRFIERLRAAIAADRKHQPLVLGRNLDRSDDIHLGRPVVHGAWGTPLSVNGVTYA